MSFCFPLQITHHSSFIGTPKRAWANASSMNCIECNTNFSLRNCIKMDHGATAIKKIFRGYVPEPLLQSRNGDENKRRGSGGNSGTMGPPNF